MHARALEHAERELERCRQRGAHAGLAAGLAALASLIMIPFSGALMIALAAGAASEALIAALLFRRRREQIARLALDPTAYAIPEVNRYGHSCLRERDRLAAWIAEIITETGLPGTYYLSDRVIHYAGELETLARELSSADLNVLPASAVACRRLLTHGVESPLYNPRVPPEELRAAVGRIRRGIQPA